GWAACCSASGSAAYCSASGSAAHCSRSRTRTAARRLGDYEEAFWTTAQAGGDVDTTCAIVGGVLASGKAGTPPAEWARRTEALPEWVPTAV
ncbi:ADP-ribosylglycohydrolase family protein, partial [Streptomyces sp. NPDC007070]|uniref:ADP-ribosylglycohydrolase family protein n=1 Tax=Streptomyces sp. NPDC007070 TaxID=3154312 RepID=UPI0034056BA1